jgi:hypothetical protein
VSDRKARVAALGLAIVLAACTVDGRHLGHEAASSGGGAGGVPDDDWGGAAGEGPVHRWTFDANADGWVTEPGVEQSWEADDSRHHRNSGSLSVTSMAEGDSHNDYWTGASTQCVTVDEGQTYRLGVDVFVPLQDTTGGAGAAILYVNTPTCEGLRITLTTLTVSGPGRWKRVKGSLQAPAGAKSALLRLLVTKVSDGPSYEASFDNVEFGPE